MAIIEIPHGSRNKSESEDRTGRILLRRVLYASVPYPTDYGSIGDTAAEDGDPLDVLAIVQEPAVPGSPIEARPLGGLDAQDEKCSDFKILAPPIGASRYARAHSLADIGERWPREMKTSFDTCELLEPKRIEGLGWQNLKGMRQTVAMCRERGRAVRGES